MISVLLLAVALTGQAIETSSWDTIYGDEAGTYAVPAALTFRGESGIYRPRGKARGILSGVTYEKSWIEGATTVSGRWSYAGRRGWFVFDAIPAVGPHPARLQGRWAPITDPDDAWPPGAGSADWPIGYWISRGEPHWGEDLP